MNITQESNDMYEPKEINLGGNLSDFKLTDNTFNLGITYTKHVGGYRISPGNDENESVMFMFFKKPKLIHRLFCKILLGWKWQDVEKQL